MNVNKKEKPLELIKEDKSDILVIGVVGPVGSGTSWVANIINNILISREYPCEIIKARKLIKKYSYDTNRTEDKFKNVQDLQAQGDALREEYDASFVSAAFIKEIYKQTPEASSKKVFILDSLKNPAEVELLRMVYGDSFWLLGNVCDPDVRNERLKKKFEQNDGSSDKSLQQLISRDEDDREKKHGQHVSSTFEKADYFINTSEELLSPEDDGLVKWSPYKEIERFIDLITFNNPMLRPTDAEHGMYSAYAARLGSACLSRQVGATLMNDNGEILSTGCNEVPRAGGGLYGQANKKTDNEEDINSGRCYIFNGSCKNTEEKNNIINNIDEIIKEEILKSLEVESEKLSEITGNIRQAIRKSKIGDLIEFSRSVHAEMDALISAARKGVSTEQCRLFVTTFPCHNCARHIVAAGIKEVQFIEPYLKSKALDLHCDSITQKQSEHLEQGKVWFKPYEGAAPRLYRRSFSKDYEVKDGLTGRYLGQKTKANNTLKPSSLAIQTLQEKISATLPDVNEPSDIPS